MTHCPNCGIVGTNVSCPNHMTFLGINPLPDSVPMPEQSAWSSLYAEIGRLNVLLNECTQALERRNKEIERLKGLMPPDDRGPGFVGQGSWSVFAEKVVAERDALREELAERDKEIEKLRGERPAVVAWLRAVGNPRSRSYRMLGVCETAGEIERGVHRREEEKP